MKTVKVKEISEQLVDCEVVVKGWVRSLRKSKAFSFINLNDGSCQSNLQIIADQDIDGYDAVSKMTIGFCVEITGKLGSEKVRATLTSCSRASVRA